MAAPFRGLPLHCFQYEHGILSHRCSRAVAMGESADDGSGHALAHHAGSPGGSGREHSIEAAETHAGQACFAPTKPSVRSSPVRTGSCTVRRASQRRFRRWGAIPFPSSFASGSVSPAWLVYSHQRKKNLSPISSTTCGKRWVNGRHAGVNLVSGEEIRSSQPNSRTRMDPVIIIIPALW